MSGMPYNIETVKHIFGSSNVLTTAKSETVVDKTSSIKAKFSKLKKHFVAPTSAKEIKYFFLLIDDDKTVRKPFERTLSQDFYDDSVIIKSIESLSKFNAFIKAEENQKDYRPIFAGICDLNLGKGTNDGLNILKTLQTKNFIKNFYVLSTYADSIIKDRYGKIDEENFEIFRNCRGVIQKSHDTFNSEEYAVEFKEEDKIKEIKISDGPISDDFDNQVIRYLKSDNTNEISYLIAGKIKENPIESKALVELGEKLVETDVIDTEVEINTQVKYLSFKAILNKNHEDISDNDPYGQVNEFLRKLIIQGKYHFIPQLIHTLLCNPYTEIECLLNIDGHTIFYQTDYENLESDSALINSNFVKYYNKSGELEQITIGKNKYRYSVNYEINKGFEQLSELKDDYDKMPIDNLIIDFFYIKGIVTRLKQDSDEQNNLIKYYHKIIEDYEKEYLIKMLNLEMGCLLFESFYEDEPKRKHLMQAMNLPEIIDFYYCEVTDLGEEGTSKINIRNIENDFNLTESVFSTKKLVECGLEEGHCFKYIRFKEKETINPFEGNNSYVLFPITKEMFDRK